MDRLLAVRRVVRSKRLAVCQSVSEASNKPKQHQEAEKSDFRHDGFISKISSN
jgi:hypothetical protein